MRIGAERHAGHSCEHVCNAIAALRPCHQPTPVPSCTGPPRQFFSRVFPATKFASVEDIAQVLHVSSGAGTPGSGRHCKQYFPTRLSCSLQCRQPCALLHWGCSAGPRCAGAACAAGARSPSLTPRLPTADRTPLAAQMVHPVSGPGHGRLCRRISGAVWAGCGGGATEARVCRAGARHHHHALLGGRSAYLGACSFGCLACNALLACWQRQVGAAAPGAPVLRCGWHAPPSALLPCCLSHSYRHGSGFPCTAVLPCCLPSPPHWGLLGN